MARAVMNNGIDRMDVEGEGVVEDDFKSRGYQDELLRVCIEKNTIIYLPTGAGKTFIAIQAIKHFSKDVKLSIHDGGKRTVFLTNTVVLAKQQADVLKRRCRPLKTVVYTGDMNVDNWRRDKWHSEFEDNHIIVATCQIILDVLRHGFVKMTDFNLIIFDECHHGRNEHPMHQFMSYFNEYPEKELPRVIGLSGSLTSASIKEQNVVEDLLVLEATFRSTIATVEGMGKFQNVLLYSTRPKETIQPYEKHIPSQKLKSIMDLVGTIAKSLSIWPIDLTHEKSNTIDLQSNKTASPLKKLDRLLKDFVFQIDSLGLYGGMLSMLCVLVELELKKRDSATSVMKTLIRSIITECEEILHIISYALDEDEAMEGDDAEEEEEESYSTILLNSSPKVQQLLRFLQQHIVKHNASEMKGLIFVHRRHSAKIIYHIIKRYAKAANLPIRPDFMVGNNAPLPESIEAILENKINRRVLDRFNRNETNIIVASSVLEEGVDLQVCNLVISFDTPPSFRSYVQSKGRARLPNSEYVMYVENTKYNEMLRKVDSWQKVDKTLKAFLVEKAIDRVPPTEEDISREFGFSVIPPYRTAIGATVDYMSAISLLNRYCMSLPVDQFTTSAVTWKKSTNDRGKISVSVVLPIQSPIREEIIGDYMDNIKMAKRAVAVKACRILHEHGELSDNLMPINKLKCLESVRGDYFQHWKEFANDNAKMAGTKKNYRLHDIHVPNCWVDSAPSANSKCYLYVISFAPDFVPNKNDANEGVFHSLYQSNHTFGILTTKPIPRLGTMKFFQTFGAIDCAIASDPREVEINDNKLRRLRKFHATLFRNVLKTWKSFFVCDTKNSFIIAPTDGRNILWEIVDEFQQMDGLHEKSEQERYNVRYRAEDWLHRVICPWYRADQDTRYVVTKVYEHLTPFSDFPNPSHDNYAHYVEDKYRLKVVQREQFLIEVKAITQKYNRLHSGQGEDGKKHSAIRGPEILIPELCHNFKFPGDLWLKLTLIPSALHRLQFLLYAEEWRLQINRFVCLNIVNYQPQPVIDHMVQREQTDQNDRPPQISFIHPNQDNTQPRVVSERDQISGVAFDCPWLEQHEPIDIQRNLDQIYELEIDYHYQFLNKKLPQLSIIEEDDEDGHIQMDYISTTLNRQHEPMAICDTPSEAKMRIEILEVSESIRGCEQHELLAAITTSSSADVFDMERFELIGDAFLKFSASLHLIQRHVNWHEGFLSSVKGAIVSNRNLYYCAKRMGLPGMMKTNLFNPRDDWIPPMLRVPEFVVNGMKEINESPSSLYGLKISEAELFEGEATHETLHQFFSNLIGNKNEYNSSSDSDTPMQNYLGRQSVSDKAAADCVEAILGACLKSFGISRNMKLLEMFRILPKCDGHDVTKMLNVKLKSPRIRTNIPDAEINEYLINPRELETKIGYQFKDRAYLLQALTHPSYPTNRVTGCYQQLEFLGDAVLDFLISCYIFERCPQMDPGMLTDLRSALVNNITLACLCVRNDLHNYMLSQNSKLSENIARFADFQEKRHHEITEHVQLLRAEGETETNIAEYTEVPKALGDIFEAIIGGIFLDSGNDLKVTWKSIYLLIHKELDAFMTNVPIEIVRQLHEMSGVNPEFEPPVEVEGEDKVLVNLNFMLNGKLTQVHGFGTNKTNAKRAAAKNALTLLKADTVK